MKKPSVHAEGFFIGINESKEVLRLVELFLRLAYHCLGIIKSRNAKYKRQRGKQNRER